jgi:Pentapeptide repeats (9 copies)
MPQGMRYDRGMATATPPSWAHCGHGAAASDPFHECYGVTVTSSGRCLAHADTEEQAGYLTSLSPGADLDLRGTAVSEAHLAQILLRVADPATGKPSIGTARFDSATLNGVARFGSATFNGDAVFDSATFTEIGMFGSATFNGVARFGSATFTEIAMFDSANFTREARFGSATFNGVAVFHSTTFTEMATFESAEFTRNAQFEGATFTGMAVFESATFTKNALFDSAEFTEMAIFDSANFNGVAVFDSATFNGVARFDSATFTGMAVFDSATFTKNALFDSAEFTGNAQFEGATFTRNAQFEGAVFERAPRLGPLVCGGTAELTGASFGAPMAVEVAAKKVVLRRTRWAQPATVWLRYADADLSDLVADHPVTVAARSRPFTDHREHPIGESVLAGVPEQAGVASLRGVDAAHLVLTDLDLSGCLFAGTVHLDQLRLEGDCRFAATPAGIRRHRGLPVRHTRRRTLAEEQHWRHTRPRAVPGWQAPPSGADLVQPRALAAVYRALRKSYEDSSNEPGAADFYYGEMEMRRADPGTDGAERGLLTAYWALSGYGLRALRALGWLLLAVTLTMLVMMLWGLPQRDTPSLSTGTLTGRHLTLTTGDPDPENPTGPVSDRLTTERFEKSLRVVVNSVIFRSSGQDLTTTGTYTEMASRLTEPVLLGLAALAIRGRIKR